MSVLTGLWLSGCTSTPRIPASQETPSEPSESLEPTSPTMPSPADTPAISQDDPPPLQAREPEPEHPHRPTPWRVVLEHGSRRAAVDGVVLWLSQPALQGAGKKVRATPIDQKKALDPLLQAGSASFVRDRPLRIMLDPGHGGEDPGALSRDRKHRESSHVLDIARRTSSYLTRAGYEVRMTRIDDATFVPLEDRCAMATAWPADLFVSIHLNSAPNGSADGLETFVLPPRGMRATSQVDLPSLSPSAEAILHRNYPGNAQDADNLRLAFCIHRRTLKTTGFSDRGLRRARFLVLREATMPAVLVEAGFLSNRRNAELLATPEGRERVARGLYQGIVDFSLGQIQPGLPPASVPPVRILSP